MDWVRNLLLMVMVFAFAKANSQPGDGDLLQDAVLACQSKVREMRHLPLKISRVNQSNFDLQKVQLDLKVDPDVATLEGNVQLTFIAVEDLKAIFLDFATGMNAYSIQSDYGQVRMEQQPDDLLLIEFAQEISSGEEITVDIAYNGDPVGTGFGSYARTQQNGMGIIWTLSEPYGAKSWWPTKQDLNDKIDETIVSITVPENLTAVSNGLLVDSISSMGTKTMVWEHKYPIPAYLIAFAVTNYTKYSQEFEGTRRTFPIDNYIFPANIDAAVNALEKTVPIMELFEGSFGPYPFDQEKYGHAQFGWGGGMEHTTISFMGNFSQNLIAHELAHQWFGNTVTCGSWQDIWLNESFATYATGIAVEAINGPGAFKDWRAATVNSVVSADGGSVYVPAADTLSVSRVFNGRLSYRKGSMVLHMLKKKMGQTAFQNTLQEYLNDPALKLSYAQTQDFIDIANKHSEEDLKEFFEDWIYGQGYPSYQVSYSHVDPHKTLIRVSQTTSHPSVAFFEGLLPLRIEGGNGLFKDVDLDVSRNDQEFLVDTDFHAVNVLIDPDSHIISKQNSATLSTTTVSGRDLKLFPNPAGETFYIESYGKNVEQVIINDLQGRTIKSYDALQLVNDKMLFSSPQLPGLYFITINTNLGTAVKQLLVR